MKENLFDHINVRPENIIIPDGTIPESDVAEYCRQYEERIERAGGIDIQILGIGRTGHIGFNEPGSLIDSRTRLVTLDPVTRRDAAADFFGEANVPHQAITMGVGTIMKARRVLLLAFGEQKASIIHRAVEGRVTHSVPATFLQNHPNILVLTDRAAAGDLTRVDAPWMLGEIEWSPELQCRAVIWLSLKTGKSILKLDSDDYDANHLSSLVRLIGSADRLNHRVFRRVSAAIVTKDMMPTARTMLCFSPHPDDDVISMGGTITRLVQRGNVMHVAYMTNGSIAVADDHTLQMLEFWSDLNHSFNLETEQSADFYDKVSRFLAGKKPGQMDSPEVQEIKKQLRRAEALAACRWMGMPHENAHFLDMPFYRTGEVRKRPIGREDVEILLALIRRLRPEWVFVAGELSDPHGTHRLCAEAIFAALKECPPDDRPKQVWLYRGAWQEWEPDVVDMAVPLSRSELGHKIFGIFKHQSQKDKALFPGPYDDREFWQRAEARNTETAGVFNKLGLPEFYAMEAFVRYEAS
jgi:glucosamine-6-phosphate deaminase